MERMEIMSEVAVVYWSGTANTAAMATAVAEGTQEKGAEVALNRGESERIMVEVT